MVQVLATAYSFVWQWANYNCIHLASVCNTSKWSWELTPLFTV